VQLFDLCAGRGVDQALHCFFESRVAVFTVGVEEARAREEQLAVQFEDLEEFGGEVGADYVFDSDAGRFFFALLQEERLVRRTSF